MMKDLPRALALSFAQLLDPAIVRILVKTALLTILVVVALAFALSWMVEWGLARAGFDPEAYAGMGALVTVLVAALGLWLLFRIVALAILQLFADDVVAAVERRHYPQAAETMKSLPLARDIGNSARGMLRAVLANAAALPIAAVLLFTAIGPAIVFLAVNAVLLGRELQDMVWLRHPRATSSERPPLSRPTRIALGTIIAAMMAVPFINLFAPIIGAASATHLVHRKMIST